MNILFFGSTQDSVIVLGKLPAVTAVVTQPAKPVGRNKVLTKTPVETWAHEHNITCLSFPNNPEKPWLYADEQTVIDALEPMRADLIVSASYGQKIPTKTIADARFGGLNVHPSLLPRWRGADPVPWAILSGDHQTGVTVVSLSEKFDEGLIYAQKKVPIVPTDTSDPLRTKLFTLGADLLATMLPDYIHHRCKPIPPNRWTRYDTRFPYAKKFKRDDGFEAWEIIKKAINDDVDAARIERKFRALDPWPGVWSLVNNKRLKILSLHLDNGKLILDTVQLEGKKPVSWKQFQDAYGANPNFPHADSK